MLKKIILLSTFAILGLTTPALANICLYEEYETCDDEINQHCQYYGPVKTGARGYCVDKNQYYRGSSSIINFLKKLNNLLPSAKKPPTKITPITAPFALTIPEDPCNNTNKEKSKTGGKLCDPYIKVDNDDTKRIPCRIIRDRQIFIEEYPEHSSRYEEFFDECKKIPPTCNDTPEN